MTTEELINEGRKLQRECMFLRPSGDGPIVARWYDRDDDEVERTGRRWWITVECRYVPGLPAFDHKCFSVVSNEHEDDYGSGSIEFHSEWPTRQGTPLHGQLGLVLPPIDAVFARGSAAVESWIEQFGWDRAERYNDNFGDSHIIDPYERVWMKEFPLYWQECDVYAILGGWHWPCADADWHEHIDDLLMVLTLRDSEPWVEAWYTRDGDFRVIPRIT